MRVSVYDVIAKKWIAPSEAVDDIEEGKDKAVDYFDGTQIRAGSAESYREWLNRKGVGRRIATQPQIHLDISRSPGRDGAVRTRLVPRTHRNPSNHPDYQINRYKKRAEVPRWVRDEKASTDLSANDEGFIPTG